MTDISSIVSGHRNIEILHPGTGARVGIRVGIVHIDDERLQKAKRDITDRRLYLDARGKTFKATEIEENRVNLLIAAMTGWEWYAQEEVRDDAGMIVREAVDQPTFEGEVPEFTIRNIKRIITNPKFTWFTDQVNEAIGETKDFFTQSE